VDYGILKPFIHSIFDAISMKIIHQMRLKGPWDYLWKSPELTPDQLGAPTEGRQKVPVVWKDHFGDQTGLVVWSRRFQKPTNLDKTERVMIATYALEGVQVVCLNGKSLPLADQPESGFRFDVTEDLQPSNILEIEINCESAEQTLSRGMTEPAIIEIWSLNE
jgi:hypothetical protein